MSQTYQIQYFLGANSPQGFYSLYDQLLPPETANAIYIIKGGPGCGKSTLMRQVAAGPPRRGRRWSTSCVPETRIPWTGWYCPG